MTQREIWALSRPDGAIVSSNDGLEGQCHDSGVLDSYGLPSCTGQCTATPDSPVVRFGTWNGAPAKMVCSRLDDGLRVTNIRLQPFPMEDVKPLTERESEVLALAGQGFTDGDIARLLGIGSGTVRTHVRHAREKLGARSRTEAVARALLLGWLASPPTNTE